MAHSASAFESFANMTPLQPQLMLLLTDCIPGSEPDLNQAGDSGGQ